MQPFKMKIWTLQFFQVLKLELSRKDQYALEITKFDYYLLTIE